MEEEREVEGEGRSEVGAIRGIGKGVVVGRRDALGEEGSYNLSPCT